MRWFLTQEAAGEAGFDDLVAMTQVKLPARAKLELARNYWDEMGRGARGRHARADARPHGRGLGLTPTIDGTRLAVPGPGQHHDRLRHHPALRLPVGRRAGRGGADRADPRGRVAEGLKRLGCAPRAAQVLRPARPPRRRALRGLERRGPAPAGRRDPGLRPLHRRGRADAPDLRRAVLRAYRAHLWSAQALAG